MQKDQWDYTVTTDEPGAADGLNRAFNSYLRFRTDAMKNLEDAIAADPQFALPHVVKGLLIESLKKPELHPAAFGELDAANRCRPPESARERHYLAALEAALAGRLTEAVTHYQQIVRAHPLDLFAMRIAQSELFWIGEVGFDHLAERSSYADAAATAGPP